MGDRDKYLMKKYFISEKEYNVLLAHGSGSCWICGKKPVSKALAVDHDHAVHRVRITYRKDFDIWRATAEYNGQLLLASGARKSDASKEMRNSLKRASIRGLLCWKPCNTGLQKWNDREDLLQSAASYLQEFKTGSVRGLIQGDL